MESIPWYRSPVYVGVVTSIVSQIIVLIGRQDAFPVEIINGYVEAVFQTIALVALGVAEVKRRTSPMQPLAATKASAELKTAESEKVTNKAEEKKTL